MNFTFFESYFDAIRELEPVDRLAVYDAICEYGVTGNVPELTGVAAMAFKLIKPNIDKSHSRSAAGAVGAANRWQTDSKRIANGCGADSKPMQDKDKDKDKDKEKDKDNNKRFAPPTPEEVRDYCEEKGHKVDAEAFVDFYAAKGWKVGNQPMKDWRAAVRNWARRESSSPGKIRQYHNRYNDFPQRQYTSEEWKKIEHDWIMRDFGK